MINTLFEPIPESTDIAYFLAAPSISSAQAPYLYIAVSKPGPDVKRSINLYMTSLEGVDYVV